MSRPIRLLSGTRAALTEGLRAQGAACVAELNPRARSLRLVEVGTDGVRVVEVAQGTPFEQALELLAGEPPVDLLEACAPTDASLLSAALTAGVARQVRGARAQAVTLGWRAFHGVGEA